MSVEDQVIQHSEPGHDRDCALAMLNQARHRMLLDDVQVQHLLAIGWRAGQKSGYRQAIADLRAEAFRLDGLVRAGHPLGNAAVALQVSAAADFLESRISQDQPGREEE